MNEAMKRICIALAALLPFIVRAEEIKLADGRIVKGEISRVEPDGLIVLTDAGVEKFSFLALPEETQRRYGFDLKKLDQYRAEQKVMKAQQIEAQTAAVRAAQQRLADKQFDDARMEVEARILQIIDEGGLAKLFGRVKVNGTETVTLPPATGLDKSRTITRPTTSEETQVIAERVMIYGLPKGLADDEYWKGPIWPAGTYRYNSFDGSTRTVRAYATTRALALEKQRVE